ncbi:hypothetical protein FHX14_004326 [Rhizobium sp. BK619]|uniref:hypothetical protein n=1 Tax=Rhizobium TaxID=379 RepID=UPI0006986CE3|nr:MULTISPECIES: hypothetical protein [Rhizobium]MBB3648101.1 hypothetical protein [Rhizobium sp. BK619]
MSLRAVIALSMLGFLPSQSGRGAISPNGGKERLGKIAGFAGFDFICSQLSQQAVAWLFTENRLPGREAQSVFYRAGDFLVLSRCGRKKADDRGRSSARRVAVPKKHLQPVFSDVRPEEYLRLRARTTLT